MVKFFVNSSPIKAYAPIALAATSTEVLVSIALSLIFSSSLQGCGLGGASPQNYHKRARSKVGGTTGGKTFFTTKVAYAHLVLLQILYTSDSDALFRLCPPTFHYKRPFRTRWVRLGGRETPRVAARGCHAA